MRDPVLCLIPISKPQDVEEAHHCRFNKQYVLVSLPFCCSSHIGCFTQVGFGQQMCIQSTRQHSGTLDVLRCNFPFKSLELNRLIVIVIGEKKIFLNLFQFVVRVKVDVDTLSSESVFSVLSNQCCWVGRATLSIKNYSSAWVVCIDIFHVGKSHKLWSPSPNNLM